MRTTVLSAGLEEEPVDTASFFNRVHWLYAQMVLDDEAMSLERSSAFSGVYIKGVGPREALVFAIFYVVEGGEGYTGWI